MRCLGEWRHSWDSFQYAVRYVLNRKAGKSAVVDVDQIETLNKINDFVILDMSTMNVIFSLKTFVSINCYNVLRPNNLTEEYFLDWISIWDSMHNVLNGWILEKKWSQAVKSGLLTTIYSERYPRETNTFKLLVFIVCLQHRRKLVLIFWDALLHTPKLTGLILSDHYSFSSRQNSFKLKNENSVENCEKYASL